jgi:hypothetical protein
LNPEGHRILNATARLQRGILATARLRPGARLQQGDNQGAKRLDASRTRSGWTRRHVERLASSARRAPGLPGVSRTRRATHSLRACVRACACARAHPPRDTQWRVQTMYRASVYETATHHCVELERVVGQAAHVHILRMLGLSKYLNSDLVTPFNRARILLHVRSAHNTRSQCSARGIRCYFSSCPPNRFTCKIMGAPATKVAKAYCPRETSVVLKP